MIFSCSITEPGQPCVMMSGKAFGVTANVNEVNVDPVDLGHELGNALSRASTLRQS